MLPLVRSHCLGAPGGTLNTCDIDKVRHGAAVVAADAAARADFLDCSLFVLLQGRCDNTYVPIHSPSV